MSADELVAKGDQICTEERGRFDEIQSVPLTSASVGAKQAEELLAAESAQDDLRDIDPPEEIRDSYDSYLDARDEVGDLLERGRKQRRTRTGRRSARPRRRPRPAPVNARSWPARSASRSAARVPRRPDGRPAQSPVRDR